MAAGKWNMQKASGGVASITVADGVGATNIVLPESGTVATTDNIVGFKNYIINGNFDIWQYGTSQTSTGYGSDDRWGNWHNGSTKTHSRVVCTDTERALFNASYFSRTAVSSVIGASNYVHMEQGIEDINRLAGKTVTLSFWAKADSNKNIAVEFSQFFGTGGTPSASIVGVGSQLIALTTIWQKKTITVTIPSIVGKTLGTDGVHNTSNWIRFWFETGSSYNSRSANLGQQSGTFDIAQVQLEEGLVATPFENRHISVEETMCKRYYETGYVKSCGVATAGVQEMGHSQTYKATKRVVPTVTLISPSLSNVAVINSEHSKDSLTVYANSIASGAYAYSSEFSASAEL